MYSDVIREREELSEQIRALEDLKELGNIYGFDTSKAGLLMSRKPSSGPTWATWPLSKSRTAQPCRLDAPPPSWIFMLSAI